MSAPLVPDAVRSESTDFVYDHAGRLVQETMTRTFVNNASTQYVVTYLYDESSIVGMRYNGVDYYFQRNLQGDVVGVYDNTGTKVASFRYDAYGNCTASGGTLLNFCHIRYRGYYYDAETELYWVTTRYYSPALCRWISPDSIEYLDPESSHGLNLYAYCGNDPVNYADPSGNFAISALIIGAIIGAAIGFGAAAYVDYQDDGEIFNGSVAWYDYLGASVLGGLVGAGLGAFAGMSFSATLPTLGLINSGGALMLGVTGTMAVTVTGAQVLGVASLLGATYVFASNNRPGNNRAQNKQFEQAAKSAGYNPNDPRVRDKLSKVHQFIRKKKLNLGWKELLELIKEWLG